MAFELIQPGQWQAREALSEEEASIGRTGGGQLAVHRAALETVGIKGDRCVVLADPDTLRIALRPVDDGEEMFAVRVGAAKSKHGTSNRRVISIARALRKLSLEPSALAGSRYKLTTKGSLLIVNLTGQQLTGGDGESEAARKGK